jgi:hypothetical protein
VLTPDAARALAEAGPWAVVIFIGALAGITFTRAILTLWREHLKADQDDRDQRDRAIALAESSVASNKAMAAAWEARNKLDAARHRRADKP